MPLLLALGRQRQKKVDSSRPASAIVVRLSQKQNNTDILLLPSRKAGVNVFPPICILTDAHI